METSFVGTTISTSKNDFLAQASALDDKIVAAIKDGTLKLIDSVIYSAKALNADTTVKLIQESDTPTVGVTNLNNAKLEANNYMLLKAVRLQTATIAGADPITPAMIAAADFSTALNPIVANGELEINVAGKTYLAKASNQIFNTNSASDRYGKGHYILDNPKLIASQAVIKPTLYLNASTGGRIVVRIELIGTRTI